MSSKVYCCDFHCQIPNTIYKKLYKLIDDAGMGEIDFSKKFVAVKIHFGEYGNVGHIRHGYAKIVCDYIKERGGIPFLTDASTLYVGFRNNAIKHLECAALNGFTPLSCGVQTIIADGLRGTDERQISVPMAKHCKNPKIASAIAEADVIISMSHAKGHESAGFGGAIKNLGMGSGSKSGKKEMHSSGIAKINRKKCIGCGMCEKHCNNNGVRIKNNKAFIDNKNCVGCGYCFAYCPNDAIGCKNFDAPVILNEKIAEYAYAAIKDKPSFHISFVNNVTINCDCTSTTDVSMVPDLGIFASYDPVALDKACVDSISKQPIFEDSPAGIAAKAMGKSVHNHTINPDKDTDIFNMVHPDTSWKSGLIYAEKLGLGSCQYSLIKT